MGRLTATQIRNLREPGRCNDGDGLFLELTGPNKGNWQLRATINGRRRDIRVPLSDTTLLKILRYAELPYTVHGFRSAFRDWAAEQTSYPGEVAEAALAHSIANGVEAAYRCTDYLDKRPVMMADWGAFCTVTGREADKLQAPDGS